VLNELKQLDVDRVSMAAAGGPIAHAMGIGGASAEVILVAAGTALQGLSRAVMLARDWRKREPEGGVRRVRIQINADALELPYATSQDQEEECLVGMFLERHAAKAPE
jgi:hypothetical protein